MDYFEQMWRAIQRSPFMTVYVSELYWLAKHVQELTSLVFEDTQPPALPGEGYIKVDPALHSRILSILTAAARIRGLVLSRTLHPKGKGARDRQEILALRTSALRQVLDGIDLAPVLNSGARNSVEHFDEYVDEVAIKLYRGTGLPPALCAVDIVLSSRRLLDRFGVGSKSPTTYFVRAYIADERVFTNCGRELSLEPLRDCATSIRSRIEPMLPEFATKEQGGSMFMVTDATFPDKRRQPPIP